MPNIGPLEIAIVLIIALIIFGPSKLPELGKSVGKGFREFKSSVTGDDDEETRAVAARAEEATEERVEGEVVGSRS